MHIRVTIDRIILDGYPLDAAGRAALQASLESELGSLLAQGQLTPELLSGANLSALAAPPLSAVPGGPGALGRQIARSIAAGLTGGNRT